MSLWKNSDSLRKCLFSSTNASAKNVLRIALRGGRVSTKAWGRRRIPGVFHGFDWSLAVILGEMVRPSFQTSHGVRTKHTAVWSPVFLSKGCTGHPGCIASSEGRMNLGPWWVTWPSGRPTILRIWPFDQIFGVGSLKSTLYFNLVSKATEESWAPIHRGWRREQNGRIGVCDEFRTLVLLRPLSRLSFSFFTMIPIA